MDNVHWVSKNFNSKNTPSFKYTPVLTEAGLDEVMYLAEDGYYYEQISEKSSCAAEINNPNIYSATVRYPLTGDERRKYCTTYAQFKKVLREREERKKMKEDAFKKKLKKTFPDKTWTFSPVQSGMGAQGIPDILMCVPTVIRQEDVGKTIGRFVAIEAKIHPNKPTPLQTYQLEGIAQASGQALIVTGHKDPKKPYKTEEVVIK